MTSARVRPSATTPIKAALFGAALALSGIFGADRVAAQGAQGAQGDSVALSFDEALALGHRAWLAGDAALSNRIARALAEARPENVPALLMLSASETALGRPAEARDAARRAFARSESNGARYEASYLVASSAMAEDRYIAAQFWLRRAYQSAETDADRETIARAFSAVRRESPWAARVSFEVAPSSNVNGGAQSPLLVIDDSPYVGLLSGAARALSGTEARLYARVGYTLSESQTHRTRLTFRGYRSFVTLSDEAQEIAPRAEGRDFEYGIAELGVQHRLAEVPGPLPDTVGLAFGQTWYGGEPLDSFVRLNFGRTVRLAPRTALTFGAESERRWSDTDAADRVGREIDAWLTHRLEMGMRLHAGLALSRVTSDDANREYEDATATAGFSMGEPVMGVRLSGSLSYTERDYDSYAIGFIDVPGGRQDSEWSARLDMEIHHVDVMGFVPVLSLTGRQSVSNVSRFEGDSVGVSVGFSSAF